MRNLARDTFLTWRVLTLPIIPALLIFSVFCLWLKFIVWCSVKIQYGKQCSFVKCNDTLFLLDYKPRISPIVMTTYFEDPDADVEFAREYVQKVFHRDDKGSSFDFGGIRKLQCYPFSKYGYKFWMNASSDFDVNFHVKIPDDIPEDGFKTEEEFIGYVSIAINKPFVPHKPHWEILVVPVMVDSNRVFGYILKYNHAYMDGPNCLNSFLCRFVDRSIIIQNQPNIQHQNILDSTLKWISGASAMATHLNWVFTRKHPLKAIPLTGENVVAVSEIIDSTIFKYIQERYSVSREIVILSTIADAITKFFSKMRMNSHNNVLISEACLLKLPQSKDKLENNVGMKLFLASTLGMSPGDRLYSFKNEYLTRCGSPESQTLRVFQCFLNVVPDFLFKFIVHKLPPSELNIVHPAIPNQPKVNGKLAKLTKFFVPVGSKQGIGFSSIVEGNRTQLSITVDKAIMKSQIDANNFLTDWADFVRDLYEEIK